jgi:hypothetical protein
LYIFPFTVLKSSAKANVANKSDKIAVVVARLFTRGAFCLLCFPHANEK